MGVAAVVTEAGGIYYILLLSNYILLRFSISYVEDIS